MKDEDLKGLLEAAEILGRAKAKKDLLDVINRVGIDDLYRVVRPSEILTEVFVWIRQSDVKK
jgi:hypothetical protein